MGRVYMLRNHRGEFFAGYSPTGKPGAFDPYFTRPLVNLTAQGLLIHEENIKDHEETLAKQHGIVTERIQVG